MCVCAHVCVRERWYDMCVGVLICSFLWVACVRVNGEDRKTTIQRCSVFDECAFVFFSIFMSLKYKLKLYTRFVLNET